MSKAEQRAARDARIAAAVADGASHSEVATSESISTKTVQRALDRVAAKDRPPLGRIELAVLDPLEIDPLAQVARSFAVIEHTEGELLSVAAHTGTDAVKVGALRDLLKTAQARLDLLERIGFLPHAQREWWGPETSWAAAWRALSSMAEENGIDIAELQERFRELQRDRPTPAITLMGLGPQPTKAAA
ncbi:MAG: hypothetical protein JWQ18_1567 [Conexibacter sp.]|nr:hypothetical protein [Conexibacter sp.]